MLFIGPDDPPNMPFSYRDLDPQLMHGSLGPPESAPKWYLDRFSRFAGLTNVTNVHADTDYCICSNRSLSLAFAAVRPNDDDSSSSSSSSSKAIFKAPQYGK